MAIIITEMLCNMIWKLHVLETGVYALHHFWISIDCTQSLEILIEYICGPFFNVANTDISSMF